jgi:hypothetical protein
VNGPTTLLQQQADIMQGMLDRISTISKEAAKDDDDGTWGVDGWIRTMHNLIDLGVRMYANFIEAAIANPFWWMQPVSGDPEPSEPITVLPRKYPRKLEVIQLARVGYPKKPIPKSCFGFKPAVLPPGVTQFRMYLKDYNYVGANYTGKISLTNTTDPKAKPDDRRVTVGL